MRISRIKIQNFRSIQSLDFPLGNNCALIGPNNAGKSNILLALQHVLGRDWVSVTTFEEDDVYGRDGKRDIKSNSTQNHLPRTTNSRVLPRPTSRDSASSSPGTRSARKRVSDASNRPASRPTESRRW